MPTTHLTLVSPALLAEPVAPPTNSPARPIALVEPTPARRAPEHSGSPRVSSLSSVMATR